MTKTKITTCILIESNHDHNSQAAKVVFQQTILLNKLYIYIYALKSKTLTQFFFFFLNTGIAQNPYAQTNSKVYKTTKIETL